MCKKNLVCPSLNFLRMWSIKAKHIKHILSSLWHNLKKKKKLIPVLNYEIIHKFLPIYHCISVLTFFRICTTLQPALVWWTSAIVNLAPCQLWRRPRPNTRWLTGAVVSRISARISLRYPWSLALPFSTPHSQPPAFTHTTYCISELHIVTNF